MSWPKHDPKFSGGCFKKKVVLGPGRKKTSPIYFELHDHSNWFVLQFVTGIMNIACTIQVTEIEQVTEKDETEPSKLEQTKHF